VKSVVRLESHNRPPISAVWAPIPKARSRKNLRLLPKLAALLLFLIFAGWCLGAIAYLTHDRFFPDAGSLLITALVSVFEFATRYLLLPLVGISIGWLARGLVQRISVSTAISRHATSKNLWSILVISGLFAWLCIGLTYFSQNRYLMAFWFVFTRLLLPIAAFSTGWIVHTIVARREPRSFSRLLGTHACLLLLFALTLPLALGAINLLPVGHSTGYWRGKVIESEQIRFGNQRYSTATINSETVGPLLRFVIPNRAFRLIEDKEMRGLTALVGGHVTRGFLGIPIEATMDPIVSRFR